MVAAVAATCCRLTFGASVLVVGLEGEASLRLFLDDFLSNSAFLEACFLFPPAPPPAPAPLRLFTPLAAGEVDLPPFAVAPPPLVDLLPPAAVLVLPFSCCCLRDATAEDFFKEASFFSSFLLFLSLAAAFFLDPVFFLEGCGSFSSLGALLRVLGAAAAPPFLLGPAPSLKLEKNKRRN